MFCSYDEGESIPNLISKLCENQDSVDPLRPSRRTAFNRQSVTKALLM